RKGGGEGISRLLSTRSHPVLPGGLAHCPGHLLGPRDKPSLGRSQEWGKNKGPMIWEHRWGPGHLRAVHLWGLPPCLKGSPPPSVIWDKESCQPHRGVWRRM
uniref:Uncharacterized protein n=1 Tax=Mustela putorius furo TaxID=9669 RepID=M3YMH5_MUSPF